MFNSIAAAQHRAVGRDTVSIVLAAGLLAGVFALALLMPAHELPVELKVPPLPRFVEVAMVPMGGAVQAKAASASPKADGQRRENRAEAAPSAVPPETPVTAQLLADDAVVAEAGGGDGDLDDGTPGGGDGITDIGGTGGTGTGTGTGGGPGPRIVHGTELQVKLRVQPRFPDAARLHGRSEEKCVLRITVNQQGEPEHVAVRNCPEMLREAAVEAAYGWRWYPLVENGVAERAQFDLNFVFRLR